MSTCNYYNKKWCHYIWRWDGKNPKDKKKIVAGPLWGRNFFSQSAKIVINRHFSSFHTAVTIGNLWKRTQRAKHSGWKPLRIERWWIKQIWMRTWGLVHVHRHVLERERRFLNADIWAVVNKDRKSPAQTRAINSDTITHLEKMGLFEFVKAA